MLGLELENGRPLLMIQRKVTRVWPRQNLDRFSSTSHEHSHLHVRPPRLIYRLQRNLFPNSTRTPINRNSFKGKEQGRHGVYINNDERERDRYVSGPKESMHVLKKVEEAIKCLFVHEENQRERKKCKEMKREQTAQQTKTEPM